MSSSVLNRIHYLPFISALILIVFIFNNTIAKFDENNYTPPAVNSDEHQYLAMSMNIYKYSIISHDDPRTENVFPAWYREPLYPSYISLAYNFLDWNNFDYMNCIYKNSDIKCNNLYKILFYFNLLIYFLIVLIALFVLKKKIIASFLLLFFLSIVDPAHTIADYTPELLSSLLLISFSYLLYIIIKEKKYNIYLLILSGFVFAGLIYVKNIFYYLSILIAFFSLLVLIINYININFVKNIRISFNNNIFLKLSIISIIAICLILPYQIRNVMLFGDSSLTKRGPEVLTIRNEFLNFSYPEITEGFYWYVNNFFGFKNNYLNLRPSNEEFKFYEGNQSSWYKAYNRNYGYIISRINKENGTSYKSVESIAIDGKADYLESYNIKIYIKNIPKQAYISFMMFFRGINNHSYNYDNYNISTLTSDIIWYLSISYFLFNFFRALIKLNTAIILLSLPTIFFLFSMSVLTHYEPRFNYTIIFFCIIYGLNFIYDKKY